MNGNICRCATYLRIRQAIHRAAHDARGGRNTPNGDPNDEGGAQ